MLPEPRAYEVNSKVCTEVRAGGCPIDFWDWKSFCNQQRSPPCGHCKACMYQQLHILKPKAVNDSSMQHRADSQMWQVQISAFLFVCLQCRDVWLLVVWEPAYWWVSHMVHLFWNVKAFIVVGTGIVLNCQTVSCDVLIMFLIYPTLAISEAFSMFILGALV